MICSFHLLGVRTSIYRGLIIQMDVFSLSFHSCLEQLPYVILYNTSKLSYLTIKNKCMEEIRQYTTQEHGLIDLRAVACVMLRHNGKCECQGFVRVLRLKKPSSIASRNCPYTSSLTYIYLDSALIRAIERGVIAHSYQHRPLQNA